jgi:hypothetical protein
MYKQYKKKIVFFTLFLTTLLRMYYLYVKVWLTKIKKMQIVSLFRKCVAHTLNNILIYKKANINHLHILNSLHS